MALANKAFVCQSAGCGAWVWCGLAKRKGQDSCIHCGTRFTHYIDYSAPAISGPLQASQGKGKGKGKSIPTQLRSQPSFLAQPHPPGALHSFPPLQSVNQRQQPQASRKGSAVDQKRAQSDPVYRAKAEVEFYSQFCDSTAPELVAAKSRLDSAIQSQAENLPLDKRVSALQNQLRTKSQQLARALARLDAIEGEIQTLNEESIELQSSTEELESGIEDIQGKLQDLQKGLPAPQPVGQHQTDVFHQFQDCIQRLETQISSTLGAKNPYEAELQLQMGEFQNLCIKIHEATRIQRAQDQGTATPREAAEDGEQVAPSLESASDALMGDDEADKSEGNWIQVVAKRHLKNASQATQQLLEAAFAQKGKKGGKGKGKKGKPAAGKGQEFTALAAEGSAPQPVGLLSAATPSGSGQRLGKGPPLGTRPSRP